MSFFAIVVFQHRGALEVDFYASVSTSTRHQRKEEDLLKLAMNNILLLSKRVCEFDLVVV